ncbi:MAG: hypothetical protein HQ518_13735 [Rhodopirellula sp.]|nr:hypothetical protein [Rhodopirellula sp.]
MSFEEAFLWTLLRSFVAATLAIPMSKLLSRLVLQATGRWRFWCLLLVLSPLFAPDLVVGYSYRSFELSLLHRPLLNHCFYFVLLLLKFLPAAAVVRICSPPDPISQAALHCARLADAGVRLSWLLWQMPRQKMVWTSLGFRHLPAFGIVFLLAMQEFEIASLLQIPAWTVHLFDAQAGGLEPAATTQHLVLPVLIQAAVFVPLIWWGLMSSRHLGLRWRLADESLSRVCWGGVAVATVAATVLWVVPLTVVSMSGFSGLSGVIQNEILVRSTFLDLAAAIAIAAPCAVLSLVVARQFRRSSELGSLSGRLFLRRIQLLLAGLAVAPGLFGSLAVSIGILSVIQQPPLTELRSTVWPMAFALILFLIPRACLLTLLLPSRRESESSHLATLLDASAELATRKSAARLKWWYECRPLFLVATVLFYWGLANLTAAALLCPPTIPLLSFDGNIVPLPVRLYKFIHQGRTATLSVMALLSVVVPLLFVVTVSRVAPGIYLRLSLPRTGRF